MSEIALRDDLLSDFFLFTRTFFEKKTGREFMLSQPLSNESHFKTIIRELYDVFLLRTNRLLINVSPGWGKSELLKMFICWATAHYPDSNHLYISYSHELASSHTHSIKQIMALPIYKHLFNVEIPRDSSAKDFFKTSKNGAVAAFGSAGAITGRDGGLPGLNRYSGAVICFPYDELVQTEYGPIKIGDIVNKRIECRVPSVNLNTSKIEYKKITNWHENPGDEILEIQFSDDALLRCTPKHNIWTDTRGWVEAKDLLLTDKLPSPSPNCPLGESHEPTSFSLGNREVFQDIHLLVSEKIEFMKRWLALAFVGDSVSGFLFPYLPSSYFMDSFRTNIIFYSQYFGGYIRFNYINNVISTQFRARMNHSHRKSTMLNSILHIIGFTTVTKIFNSIIETISIYMSHLNTLFLFTKECPSNNSVNGYLARFPIFSNGSSQVFPVVTEAKSFNFNGFCSESPMITITDNALFASNPSRIGRTIKSLIPKNRSPVLIRNIGHVENTYCITVEDNHNFFAGTYEDKYVIVRNCDDLHKNDEVHSDVMRERVKRNFFETILPRCRGINVPIVVIGQRLHEDDIFASLLRGDDGHEWKHVVIKALDDAGNARYPEVKTREQLLIMKEKQPYVFASQYQQDPIPAGGALYKADYFPLLDKDPNILATFITADTAETDKDWNDKTVFSFWGVYKVETRGAEVPDLYALHWLDCRQLQIEPKDIEDEFLDFWATCMQYKVKPQLAIIEKKSTGVTLVSVLKKAVGIKVIPMDRTIASGSKGQRYIDMQQYIASKLISLPEYGRHTKMCIDHMIKITANNTHRFDDICDTAYDAVRAALIDKTVVYKIDQVDYDHVAKNMSGHQNKIDQLRVKSFSNFRKI